MYVLLNSEVGKGLLKHAMSDNFHNLLKGFTHFSCWEEMSRSVVEAYQPLKVLHVSPGEGLVTYPTEWIQPAVLMIQVVQQV
jgi:hypothetical protein